MLSVAYQLFAKRGFENTSLSLIADKVGITKPAIYYDFTSKDHFIDRLFDKVIIQIEYHNFFRN
ncbi:helix-turn-helix transcriptional regulator [Hazenella sp. IB182353]|nr:helix-turn-helix transcriptional regulator [Polycladospora coralii]